jgi:hypothetical protein
MCSSLAWASVTVYVGTSGGAMVATPDFGGETYDDSEPITGSDRALGLVDFSVFPHLEREDMPDTSLANIERWAAGSSVPAYAIDDQTAIEVVDGTVEVVSEGLEAVYPEPGSKLVGAGDTRRSTAPAFGNDAIGLRRAVHAHEHQGGSGGHRP